MMSGRNVRESLLGSLNHHRRGHSFNGVANNNHHHDDNLDLFSDNRRSLALAASSDDSSDGACLLHLFFSFSLFLISPNTFVSSCFCFCLILVSNYKKKKHSLFSGNEKDVL